MEYNSADIAAIIEVISWNPKGFRQLAAKHSSVTDHEICGSMKSWGIDSEATYQAYPTRRAPRQRPPQRSK